MRYEIKAFKKNYSHVSACWIKILAFFISFQNHQWHNIKGQVPFVVKRRLHEQGYNKMYSKITRFLLFLPGAFLMAHCFYFGFLDALGKLEDRSIRMNFADVGVLCILNALVVVIASTFQWRYTIEEKVEK